MSAVGPTTSPPGLVGTVRGLAAAARREPAGALAVLLGVVVGVALLGPAPRLVAVAILVAVVMALVARGLELAWRHRAVAGPAFVVLGLFGLGAARVAQSSGSSGSSWRSFLANRADASDWAVAMTGVGIALAVPVFVYRGAHRLAGRRRAAAGTPWRSLVSATGPDPVGVRRDLLQTGAAVATIVAVLVVWLVDQLEYQEPVAMTAAFVVLLLALVAAPVLLALVVVGRSDRAERELAVHRQAVAAHLHDSVLQTFALIQRNLDDPESVRRLVRTQERELRAWLAGREVDALAETLAGALRAVADVVEEEHGVTIELDVLDDPAVAERHRPLLEASREALRNAARHGGGAAIRVLAETTHEPVPAVVVWVRDDGPGFDPATIDPERRGVRDAIVGRMRAAGGDARIDTAPGAGTEVVLTLPADPEEGAR